MHQTYGQIPDIRHVPDSGYPAACLPDPDHDRISKNANIRHNLSFFDILIQNVAPGSGSGLESGSGTTRVK